MRVQRLVHMVRDSFVGTCQRRCHFFAFMCATWLIHISFDIYRFLLQVCFHVFMSFLQISFYVNRSSFSNMSDRSCPSFFFIEIGNSVRRHPQNCDIPYKKNLRTWPIHIKKRPTKETYITALSFFCLYMWCDSFICAAWLIHACDMTDS